MHYSIRTFRITTNLFTEEETKFKYQNKTRMTTSLEVEKEIKFGNQFEEFRHKVFKLECSSSYLDVQKHPDRILSVLTTAIGLYESINSLFELKDCLPLYQLCKRMFNCVVYVQAEVTKNISKFLASGGGQFSENYNNLSGRQDAATQYKQPLTKITNGHRRGKLGGVEPENTLCNRCGKEVQKRKRFQMAKVRKQTKRVNDGSSSQEEEIGDKKHYSKQQEFRQGLQIDLEVYNLLKRKEDCKRYESSGAEYRLRDIMTSLEKTHQDAQVFLENLQSKDFKDPNFQALEEAVYDQGLVEHISQGMQSFKKNIIAATSHALSVKISQKQQQFRSKLDYCKNLIQLEILPTKTVNQSLFRYGKNTMRWEEADSRMLGGAALFKKNIYNENSPQDKSIFNNNTRSMHISQYREGVLEGEQTQADEETEAVIARTTLGVSGHSKHHPSSSLATEGRFDRRKSKQASRKMSSNQNHGQFPELLVKSGVGTPQQVPGQRTSKVILKFGKALDRLI